MSDHYRFGFEVVRDFIDSLGTPLSAEAAKAVSSELSLEDIDDSDLLVLRREDLHLAALALDPITRTPDNVKREVAARNLARHTGCEAIVAHALASRNDLIVALNDSQDYCFNDMLDDGWGDLYVILDRVLDELRPRPASPRPLLEPERCPECLTSWTHAEDCAVGQHLLELADRRVHEIASHTRCGAIADELWRQTDALLHDLQVIAHDLFERSRELEGEGRVLTIDSVTLDCMRWEFTTAFGLVMDPTSLTAEIYPPLEDREFCHGTAHSDPHRGCRYLIS